MSLRADKSREALHRARPELDDTERATQHLPAVFAHLFCVLERVCAKKSVPSSRQPISETETDPLVFDNTAIVSARGAPSSAKESSATVPESSPITTPTATLVPVSADTHLATGSAGSQGQFNQIMTCHETDQAPKDLG
jgi:hypothetical protein